jgi:hypothetical protein
MTTKTGYSRARGVFIRGQPRGDYDNNYWGYPGGEGEVPDQPNRQECQNYRAYQAYQRTPGYNRNYKPDPAWRQEESWWENPDEMLRNNDREMPVEQMFQTGDQMLWQPPLESSNTWRVSDLEEENQQENQTRRDDDVITLPWLVVTTETQQLPQMAQEIQVHHPKEDQIMVVDSISTPQGRLRR